MKDSEKNHIDEWLLKQIKKGIVIIDKVLTNNVKEWELYYTGHLQKDISVSYTHLTLPTILLV